MALTDVAMVTALIVVAILAIKLFDGVSADSARTQRDINSDRLPKRSAPISLLHAVLQGFDPLVRPNADGGPVEVRCGFHLVSLSSISEVSMDYKVDVFLRQMWEDPRLNYTEQVGPNHTSPLAVPSKLSSRVWQPPIHFPNEKHAQLHTIPIPSVSYKIFPNGTIFYSIRVTLTLACPMDLSAFPMDKQNCLFKIESYSMTTRDLKLTWQPNPIIIDEELELPQFQLVGTSTNTCLKEYTLGTFSCLTAVFELHREYGFFLLQTYIPSMLIVILSWVSFWISMDAVPARISLGVTTVLTMATQLSGSKESIPRVSYPKAIDIWMSMCMAFVFVALLEYAFVNALSRAATELQMKEAEEEEERKEQIASSPSQNNSLNNEEAIPLETTQLQHNAETSVQAKQRRSKRRQVILGITHRQLAHYIDWISRALFPGIFIAFCITYWVVYTN